MGNYFFGKQEEEDSSLSIEISLPKSCYYPGEKLSGVIIIQAKTSKVPSIFNFPNSIITLTQHQHYQFYHEDIQINKDEEKPIFFHRLNFKKYKNRNILSPLKIPFSFKIDNNIYPTLIHDNGSFIKHILTIKFPKIKRKKSVGIIIQNLKLFSNENKLLKSPAEKFKDLKKSPIFKKPSRIALLIKTEKNSYAYNELIPYEIVINYTESNIIIKQLRVSITRNIYINSDDFIDIKLITYQDYEIIKDSDDEGVFKICGYFSFPPISEYFSVNPMNVYNFYSNKIIDNVEKTFDSLYLYPTCFSNFLTCYYSLNLQIFFDSVLLESEKICIPIELYTPIKFIEDKKEEEDNDNSDIENEIEETINNRPEIIKNETNDNLVNKDFEIINRLDFYKVLSEKK